MPDEAAPAQSPQELELELRKSRETAALLLDNLARKIGASRAVHEAASGVQRAARYVRSRSPREMAWEFGRLIRKRPIVSIAVAGVVGFLIARLLRRYPSNG